MEQLKKEIYFIWSKGDKMAKLEIYLLGRIDILWQGQSILDKLSHKSIGILSYISGDRDKAYSRNKIANIFWDSSDSSSSRYNLRYNIWSLRKIFKSTEGKLDLFISDKENIRLNEEFDVYIDAEDFQKRIEKNLENSIEELEKIKNLYKGEFLEGFYIKDSSQFNDWVFYEREKFQRNYIKVLSKLQNHYKSQGKYQKAIDILEDRININPLKEELYLELIKIYLQLGDRNLALQHYKRCCRVLREELNIGPMEETKKIYSQIQKGEVQTSGKVSYQPQQKKTSSSLYYTEENKLKTVLEKFNDKKILSTTSYPIGYIEYYWIVSLVEEIINKYDDNILKNLPEYYWNDITILHSPANKYIKDTKVNTPKELIKIRLFNTIESLLKELSTHKSLTIVIDKLSTIDKPSLEFIKYILYREKIKDMTMVLIGEKKGKGSSNIGEIEKYFKIEEIS